MLLWMTRGWNWLTAGRSKIKTPSRKGSYPLEPMKPVATDNLFDLILWHKWTVISITGSVIVIYLNLAEYVIAGELGKNSAQTANILGALQLVIKAHELCIVASLVCIAKQWILSSFMDMDRGMVLGLVGAEGMLGQPSFLISKEFYAAFSYGLSGLWWRQSGTQKKRQIFTLSVFISLACVISALSGPASGALLIPRVDWFFEREFTGLSMSPTYHFPNILIDQRYGYGMFYGQRVDPFASLTSDELSSLLIHWDSYMAVQDNTSSDKTVVQEERHSPGDLWGRPVTITSTTWNRAMGGDWTGSSTATITMRSCDFNIIFELNNQSHERKLVSGYLVQFTNQIRRSKWKGLKYESYGAAVRVQTECHYGLKKQCESENSTDWCYTRSSRDSALQSSRNLLLLFRDEEERLGLQLSIFLTEGPRSEKFPNFATSIEFVIEGLESSAGDPTTTPRSGIVVCSVSARIGSTTISATDTMVDHEYSPYADYQILGNGTKEPSRQILYHEHWIDSIGATRGEVQDSADINMTGEVNFGPRNPDIVTQNPTLQGVAGTIAQQFKAMSAPDSLDQMVGDLEAARIELPIAGAMSAILCLLSPTHSQYVIPDSVLMPDTFLPTQLFYDTETIGTLKAYNLGYGFRLSTRTGILGVAVLLCHVVIALAGSFWQVFWWRKVITAWSTVPDYLALGVGSSTVQPGFENTCAGVSAKRTLQSIVTIENSVHQHLGVEVTVAGTTFGTQSNAVARKVVPILSRVTDLYGGRGSKLE